MQDASDRTRLAMLVLALCVAACGGARDRRATSIDGSAVVDDAAPLGMDAPLLGVDAALDAGGAPARDASAPVDAGEARVDGGPRDGGPAPVAAAGTYVLGGTVYPIIRTACSNFGTRGYAVSGVSREDPLQRVIVIFDDRPPDVGTYPVVAPLPSGSTASIGAEHDGLTWGSRPADGMGYYLTVRSLGGRLAFWFNDVPLEDIPTGTFTTVSANFACP